MKRFIQILTILLIIQIAITAFIFWPQGTAQAISGPLLPDFAATDVVTLTIHDNNDNRLVLAKHDDEWVLPEADDFPVDSEKVATLFEAIESVETNRLVTQTEASHKRLKVDQTDFNRLVEIALEDGTTHKVYIGSAAGAGATHVRIDDQTEVYLSDIRTFDANAQASSWVDTLYHSVNRDDVVALTLENENGTFEFEKDGDTWMMLGLDEYAVFDETRLTGLLGNATSVRMTAPLGKEEKGSYKLHEPLAVVTLKTMEDDEEKTYTLQVGAKINDGYVVKSSESPYFVQVSEFTGNSYVDKTLEDFLEEPATEEAEETTIDTAETE